MRAIRKVTAGELLLKQGIRKQTTRILYIYMELGHWSYWRTNFCIPVSKKSSACELNHVYTRSIKS